MARRNSLVPRVVGEAVATPRQRRELASRVLDAWLNESPTGSEHTRTAKLRDLDAFCRFLEVDDVGEEATRVEAVAVLLFGGFAAAQESVRGWLAWMAARVTKAGRKQARFAPATRARRLAHLRSLVRVAQEHGLPWGLQLRGPRVKPYRDASGPEAWKVYAVIAELVKLSREADSDTARAMAARDVVILQLLFCLGLRRQTVADLALADVDGDALWVRVKGEEEPRRKTIPRSTKLAIDAWLEHRGRDPGPLITGVRSHHRGNALEGWEIWRIASKHVSNPHGLRHSGATKLAREHHNVYAIQAHLGHANAMTAQHYIDAHEDAPGVASAYLAEQLAALYDGPDGNDTDSSGHDLPHGQSDR